MHMCVCVRVQSYMNAQFCQMHKQVNLSNNSIITLIQILATRVHFTHVRKGLGCRTKLRRCPFALPIRSPTPDTAVTRGIPASNITGRTKTL